MANISTENINTLAQLAASISDGDYIYIYKSSSNSFARIEKSIFLSGIAGGATSSKVKANVNALQEKIDELIQNLAPLAYNGNIPDEIGALDWDEEEPTPTPSEPTLTSPTSTQVNVGTNTGSGVSKSITVKGSNLTQALTVSISGSGFSVNKQQITAASANSGTTVTVTYSGTSTSASASLTISSSEVSVVVPLVASYNEQTVVTTHDVTINSTGISHCSYSHNMGVTNTVEDGGTVTITIAPSSGYTLSGATSSASATNGTVTKTYNSSTDRIIVTVSNITADTTITIAATAVEQSQTGYYTNGLVLHLDCKDRGGTTGHWIDKVGNYDFVLTNCTESDTGVVFSSSQSSKGVCDDTISVTHNVGTIEVVFSGLGLTNKYAPFRNNISGGICFSYWVSKSNNIDYKGFVHAISGISNTKYLADEQTTSGVISMNTLYACVNGVEQSISTGPNLTFSYHSDIANKMTLGFSKNSSGAVVETYMTGTILAIRVYNRQLSVSEMQHNQSYDAEYYGLTLDTENGND